MAARKKAPRLSVIHRDRGILGGIPVFRGTRVPIKSLFDHVQAGDTIERFLEQFPSVTRAQAEAVLQLAENLLLDDARATR